MPEIFIKKLNRKIDVPLGSNLMKSLLNSQIPVASSCAGDGVCHKCFIFIEKGLENLSERTPTEEHFIAEKQITEAQRLSCQALVLGDITVHAPYW
ncbi:MAG TPA: 2Fe-2S iron-sulfur cluster-binding protein [Pseudobdellovibrionaceae bacterium]|nr:2Fe-2S iron-sulfur cluster-binding protein [Pseudobdellovibrionaceae bacterium]